ncbi:sigma-70 family RNA polymerase sigma factor, partial [Candidatus Poribacteria bacterium]|nr:sigma-70 family RNA polymerase sigma factor [Candidatus Poribacteria bacterium]
MYTEDGHIIDKCLSGEPAALGFLVDKYKACIYAFAYSRVRNFHDAEDITQEVFIKAYQKLHSLKRWDKVLAWLYSITANQCKDFVKHQQRRRDRDFVSDVKPEVLEQSLMMAHREGAIYETLHDALSALPEMYRQVLILHYLGGLKSREIAQFLGTSKNTIDSRLNRGRNMLKEEMIDTMTTTFGEMKLQPAFTFRVVEAIKRTKIQSTPTQPALPIGAGLVAAALIAVVFSLTVPQSPLFPIGQWLGRALPAETQVKEIGVIPVDTIKITEIVSLSPEMADGDFGKKPLPEPTNFAGAGKWEKKADMPAARSALSASEFDGQIYVIGGIRSGPERDVGTVEAYNPITDTWQRKAGIP